MSASKLVHSFLSGFGIPAYAAASVPADATFPYLTYDLAIGSFDEDTSVLVNLWYEDTSEAAINSKAEDIRKIIGRGGTMVSGDGHAIWIKHGSPFCQSVNASGENPDIKRRYINLVIEYITNE